MTEQARILIGADGLHSLVARTVQAPSYNEKPILTCAYYSYWEGIPMEDIELYLRDRCFTVSFPTNDGLICIIVSWPRTAFQAIRTDIEGNFLKTLELIPGLLERVRNGKRKERFLGTVDQSFSRLRTPSGSWQPLAREEDLP